MFMVMPEMPEEMRRAHEMQQMEISSVRHRVLNLIHGLPKDDLDTLRILLTNVADEETGTGLAMHFAGMAAGILQIKFGVCACGIEHEDPTKIMPPPETSEMPQRIEFDRLEDFPRNPQKPGYDDLMKIFNMTPLGASGEVACQGCGLKYVSLKDRMIKAPDDCHGCHNKSAQG